MAYGAAFLDYNYPSGFSLGATSSGMTMLTPDPVPAPPPPPKSTVSNDPILSKIAAGVDPFSLGWFTRGGKTYAPFGYSYLWPSGGYSNLQPEGATPASAVLDPLRNTAGWDFLKNFYESPPPTKTVSPPPSVTAAASKDVTPAAQGVAAAANKVTNPFTKQRVTAPMTNQIGGGGVNPFHAYGEQW